mgnify:CR=1 FL=1
MTGVNPITQPVIGQYAGPHFALDQGAAARYDYSLRMMRWFDTYLKTGDRRAPLPDPRPTLAEGAGGAKIEE